MATPAASTKSVNSTQPGAQSTLDQQQSGTAQQQNGADQDQTDAAKTEPEGGYPEQKHAGAVGLGPDYAKTHSAVSAKYELENFVSRLMGIICNRP